MYFLSLTTVIQGIFKSIEKALIKAISLLPGSPFKVVLNYSLDNQILRWLNYLLPISEIIVVLEVWVTCVAAFSVVQVILRWAKACS